MKKKRTSRAPRNFRKFYFAYCSPSYNPQSEFDWLDFNNDQEGDLIHLKNLIATNGNLQSDESYKAHYRREGDKHYMDLGEAAKYITHEDDYLLRPKRKGYRH